MRFTPGKKEVFIQILYIRDMPSMSQLYVPWNDALVSITVKQLECTEHHKVPTNVSDEKTADGFIFKDEEGGVYHNQYPRAGYGQIDDSGDRQLQQVEGRPEFKADSPIHPLRRYSWTLASSYLNSLCAGQVELIQSHPDYAKQLEELYLQLLKKIRDELGLIVIKSNHRFETKDGQVHFLDNSYDFEFVPAVAEDA